MALAVDLPEAGGPSASAPGSACCNKTLQGFANVDLQQIDGAFDKAKGWQIRVRNSISSQHFLDFEHESHDLVSVHFAVLWKLQSTVRTLHALGNLNDLLSRVSSNVIREGSSAKSSSLGGGQGYHFSLQCLASLLTHLTLGDGSKPVKDAYILYNKA